MTLAAKQEQCIETQNTVRPSKETLIAYAKPYLEAQGFQKKRNRWTKNIGEFTLSFFIQSSMFDNTDYYIRPGVYINAITEKTCSAYGDFSTELAHTTPQQILSEFDIFCTEWTDKARIKQRILAFEEWENRNPVESRRTGLANCEQDPPPSRVCFSVPLVSKEYILSHY